MMCLTFLFLVSCQSTEMALPNSASTTHWNVDCVLGGKTEIFVQVSIDNIVAFDVITQKVFESYVIPRHLFQFYYSLNFYFSDA